MLNIKSSGFTNEIKVNVFDASGRQVYKDIWLTNHIYNTNQIDVSNFEKGMYLIQISDDYNTQTQRFIHE